MASEREHPLDCPAWSALSSEQASCATGSGDARRFREDIGPFAGAADNAPDSIAALAALAHDNDDMSLLEAKPPAPPAGVSLKMSAAGVQMITRGFTASGGQFPIEPLGDADSEEMVALATLTRPGPFRAKTHTLGRFLGIRDAGRLVAMAGERMQMPGFVEISAVCTHPDYRGRGYGAALMRAVGDRILREGATPFLHAYASNTGAIALYRKLGFELRAEVTHAVWSKA